MEEIRKEQKKNISYEKFLEVEKEKQKRYNKLSIKATRRFMKKD